MDQFDATFCENEEAENTNCSRRSSMLSFPDNFRQIYTAIRKAFVNHMTETRF
jgi:hypothetical protein